MECVRLAGAGREPATMQSGSKLPHSKRFARGRDVFRSAEFILQLPLSRCTEANRQDQQMPRQPL